jgi:CBS domain-containing protein
MTQARELDRLVSRGPKLLTIGPDDTVRQAAEAMSQHNVGSLLVLDRDGTLVGILSERDVLAKVTARGSNPIAVRVGEIMSHDVVSCHPAASIRRANRLMARHHIRHLPIVENGEPIGMLSARDLMAHELELVRQQEQEHRQRLHLLEQHHPGITDMTFDSSGRIVL